MKRIDTCTHTDLLVGLLLAGIVSVLLAYRIFAYLCEVPAFLWWMILLGLLCAVQARRAIRKPPMARTAQRRPRRIIHHRKAGTSHR